MDVRPDHTYEGFAIGRITGEIFGLLLTGKPHMLTVEDALRIAMLHGYKFIQDDQYGLVCTNFQEMNSITEDLKLPVIPERKTFVLTVEVNRYAMPTADIMSAVTDGLKNSCIKVCSIQEMEE